MNEVDQNKSEQNIGNLIKWMLFSQWRNQGGCLFPILSLSLSIYLSIYLFIYLSIYQSIYLSICIYLSPTLSLSLTLYLSIYLSIYLHFFINILNHVPVICLLFWLSLLCPYLNLLSLYKYIPLIFLYLSINISISLYYSPYSVRGDFWSPLAF